MSSYKNTRIRPMHFIIQTIDGQIKHDFSFTLLRSIEYQNWYQQKKACRFSLTNSESPEFESDGVPVGSVEFVSGYLEKHHGLKPLPRNIPDQLMPFAGRKVFPGTHETHLDKSYFAKSRDQIKGFTDFVGPGDPLPPGEYLFSEDIVMETEYRCFVYQRKLVGLQHYLGDFRIFPDIKTIERMIESFTRSPVAYTLDVFVSAGDTFVVEVHDFFSCGLYGFEDHRIYPFMLARWWKEFIQSAVKPLPSGRGYKALDR